MLSVSSLTLKYHFSFSDENIDIIIQKFIDETKKEIKKDDFILINYETKIDIFTEIPNSIKLALISVLEIITILNNEISKIQIKIQDHHRRWISYIYSIAIQQEMDTILEHVIIFDKRLNLLFQLLQSNQ